MREEVDEKPYGVESFDNSRLVKAYHVDFQHVVGHRIRPHPIFKLICSCLHLSKDIIILSGRAAKVSPPKETENFGLNAADFGYEQGNA